LIRSGCFVYLAAGGLFLHSSVASANPADSYGLGARSIALGGAVSSNAQDFSANYYNPGRLTQLQHTELSLGLALVKPSLEVAGKPAPASRLRSLVFGLVAPGEIGEVPVAFGLAAQLAGNRLSRVVTFAEDDQRWFLYDNRPEQIYFSANVAARPLPWLSLGAGYSFLASTRGTLQIRGTAVQPGFGNQTEFDSDLDHEVRAELLSVRYPQVGLAISPSDYVSVALVYRGEGQVALGVDSDIQGELALRSLRIPTSYILRSNTIQSHVPQQVILGFSYWPSPSTLLSAELGFPSPLSATDSELDVREPPGLKLDVPTLPEATTLSNAGLEDRANLRLGLEHWLTLSTQHQLPLRAGYAFEPTGLSQNSNANLVDTDRHLLSVGSGFKWNTPSGTFPGTLKLDVHGQLGFLPRARLPALDPGNSDAPQPATVNVAGHFVGAGLTLSYEFGAQRVPSTR
jgi:long-chain fatty acid transport protein